MDCMPMLPNSSDQPGSGVPGRLVRRGTSGYCVYALPRQESPRCWAITDGQGTVVELASSELIAIAKMHLHALTRVCSAKPAPLRR